MKAVLFAVTAAQAAPIDKVISMISELEQKVIAEGEDAHKVYAEKAEWCEDTSKDVMYEIKTGKSNVASLKATIAKESSNIDAQTASIEELAGAISMDEADLKAATVIRQKEEGIFKAKETDLAETVDILERAIGIIEKEMKGGSFAQVAKNAHNMAEVFSAMVSAESISNMEGEKLTALIQSNQQDSDESTGAPAAAVYENQSGGILDVMNDLLEKSQAELDKARNTETSDIQNFEMLKQSLEDEIKFGEKEKGEAAKSKAASEEVEAGAQGDLDVTSKDLAEDIKELAGLHHNCMTRAQEYEDEVKSRGEELGALAKAKQIIKEAVGGASMTQTEADASFLQISKLSTRQDLANFEVVRMVRQLAKKTSSAELAQLASRVASTVRFGGGSKEDIFAKVKGLITDMVEKLEAEAQADATEKAFCDKELAETNVKKDDKTAEIEKLTATIEQNTAKSGQLKNEIADLEAQLSELTKTQAEMDNIRMEEKAVFEKASSETEKALNGVKKALKVLNEYYAKADKAHSSSDGASTGIIGLLEVCESDFSKSLSEMTAAEESAVSEYETDTKENEIAKVTKQQDVKYKTKESNGLDKSSAEATSDKEGVQSELGAVNEYLKELEGRCVAKAETYAERKERREAEIAGLKEGLEVLENETAFIQKKATKFLRRH
jgi:hypothetical protein